MPRSQLNVITPQRGGNNMDLGAADVENGNYFLVDVRPIFCCFVAVDPCDVTIYTTEKGDGDLPIANRVISLVPGVPYLWLLNDLDCYFRIDENGAQAVWLDFSAACTIALVATS